MAHAQRPRTLPSAWLVTAGAIALLAIVIVGAARDADSTVGAFFGMSGAPTVELPTIEPMEPMGPAGDNGVASAILYVLAILVGLFVAALTGVLLYRLTRFLAALAKALAESKIAARTPPDQLAAGGTVPLAGLEVPEELEDAVAEALKRLDAAPTPHDAVIAAWLELEAAGDSLGQARHPAETPTEFTQRLLDATPAPPAATATLRRLYQRARFSRAPTPAGAIPEARTALGQIARAFADFSAAQAEAAAAAAAAEEAPA
jgi:hypothetical protein